MPIADDLEIVASYTFPYEADLARSLLEANEIPAWVIDALQVQQRWYISRALGGVRVAVPRARAEEARALLAQDHSAAVEDEPVSVLSGAAEETCRRCGATARVSRRRLGPRLLDLAIALVMLAPIRRSRAAYACPACGHQWSRDEDAPR